MLGDIKPGWDDLAAEWGKDTSHQQGHAVLGWTVYDSCPWYPDLNSLDFLFVWYIN